MVVQFHNWVILQWQSLSYTFVNRHEWVLQVQQKCVHIDHRQWRHGWSAHENHLKLWSSHKVFYTDNGVCQHDNNIFISMKEIEIKSLMKPLPIQHEDWVFITKNHWVNIFFFLSHYQTLLEKLQKWNLRFDHCRQKVRLFWHWPSHLF